jgi:hypothetical protein
MAKSSTIRKQNDHLCSGSDSGKESGTISGKNPGMKLDKELPDRVKLG